MGILQGQTPVKDYYGMNSYRYAVLKQVAERVSADTTRIECLEPDCDGGQVEEKFKAEVVELSLLALLSGFDLPELPNVCDCERYECVCDADLTLSPCSSISTIGTL